MLRKDPFVTGEYYHIYNRGVDKRIIFKSQRDYERFIMLLYLSNSEVSIRLNELFKRDHKIFNEILSLEKGTPIVSIGAWCLMNNHFHILIKQEVDEGITKFMKKLSTGYSMYFNIKYERTGALFGGPFKSKLIGDDDNYMRQLFAYVHLNPLEIEFPGWDEVVIDENLKLAQGQSLGKLVQEKGNEMKNYLRSYQYSSYHEYIGADRVEKGIINKQAFPPYFQENQSFDDFIDQYYKTIQE